MPNKPRILLVDDSPTILNLLSLALKQQGYEVITARDGLEALEKGQRQPVSLIITDLNMPRLDGLAFIARWRGGEGSRRTPIIMLSTESQRHDRQAGLKQGADLYLVKPVTPAQLAEAVRSLLS
ncbi:MAG: response regulator [Thermodesulfobacteriota bacterium]|jgi:two-component system chemotaxis response regulator CheY